MAKPFSIQSPEEIAKEYGGNKQKIAQAMQTGIVDPTAGVLAGMFIDRMRAAQALEVAPQPTVAQQVMGGAPPAPAAAPAPAPAIPAGLGAMQQPAPSMTPDMAQMPEAPVGMAEGGYVGPYAAAGSGNVGPQPMQQTPSMAPPYAGGLDMLSIPDTMFDEPSNGGFDDGYSGGGLVAFARGGMSNLYDDVEYWESGGKQGAVSPKGARGVMQLMPGTMRDPGFGIAPMRDDSEAENRRVGREYLDAMYRKYGDRNTALMAYNWGPGNVDKWIKAGRPADMVPAETRKYVANIGKGPQPSIPERDTSTAEGQMATVEDIFGRLQDRFGRSEEEKAARSKLMARAEEMASDEGYEKQRKADMWQTLAEIGFNMASSKSPYLLQAVGEAASAAMPGARADKKERKAIKDRGLDLMVELGASDRKEAQQLWGMAVDAAKTNLTQEQFEKRMSLEERQLQQADTQFQKRMGLEERQIGVQERLAEEGKSDLQRIFNTIYDQYKARNEQGIHPDGRRINYKLSDAEIRARAMEEAAKRLRSGQGGMALPGIPGPSTPSGGTSAPANFDGMSIVGSRPAK